MSIALNINLNSADFPEIGLPLYPKSSKDVKSQIPQLKGKIKSDYDLYVQSEERSTYDIQRDIKDVLSGSCDGNGIAFSLSYEKGIPHTYKFLGMDINDDYQAVIPVGDGYVIVGDMFDCKSIIAAPSEIDGDSLLHNVNSNAYRLSINFLKSCSSEFARKITTALKSSVLFEEYKAAEDADVDHMGPEIQARVVDIVKEYMGVGSPDGSMTYKSILLNLVHEDMAKKAEIGKTDSNDSMGAATAVAIQLFCYWNSILKTYLTIHKALSSIDMWQSVGRRLLGDKEFNSRLEDSIYLTDDSGKLPGIASISGVARNWDILDTNTNREAASTAFRTLTRKMASPYTEFNRESVRDLMISNIDWEKFDNPYELSAEDLQAVANYDSLKFIDEDVKVHAEAYDLDDPTERGMFIKSVAKSYDRNLRDYVSKDDYNSVLVDSISDLVDRRNNILARTSSDATSFTNNTDTDSEDLAYTVTSSSNELMTAETKGLMLKVAKLIRKNLEHIDKMF